MTVLIEAGGRRHAVEVRRHGSAWHVAIDGRDLSVQVTDAGDRQALLVSAAGTGSDAPRRSYDVAVEPGRGGERIVYVDGTRVPLTIIDSRHAFGKRGQDTSAGAGGPLAVTAPMAGRVVKLLVAAADTVAARQGVVVIEAMKMENELRAPRAGTVREIRAAEGTTVEARATLLVIE